MTEPVIFLSALLIGLAGSTHCIGMCGGIAASVALNTQSQRLPGWMLLLTYNLGRISSYALAGALLGLAGAQLAGSPLGVALRTFAALLLIAMGLYVGQWWFGITRLEKAGGHLWKYLQPLASRLIPVKSFADALFLGIIWGWLPCGLVYSTLLWSSAAGGWQQGAVLMLGFGIGTLPAMFVTGLLAQQVRRLMQQRWTRQLSGLLIIAMGLYTLPFELFLSA